jgi:hypothetical protein
MPNSSAPQQLSAGHTVGTDNTIERGLGCPDALLRVYVAKPPPMREFLALQQIQPLLPGQIQQIGNHCGNGWRKVFNVYAKLVFTLPATWQPTLHGNKTWQQWRDQTLLQTGGNCSLLFSAPQVQERSRPTALRTLHIIAGRQHARTLVTSGDLTVPLQWLDDEFALNAEHRVIVCPYFDYRQLSDVKIARVAAIAASL